MAAGFISLSLIVFDLNSSVAFAQSFIPLEGEGYGVFPRPEGEGGLEILKALVGRIVDNVRYIIGAVAVLMIIIASVKLVTSQGNEEVFQKQMGNILWGILGLAIIGLAGELARILNVQTI